LVTLYNSEAKISVDKENALITISVISGTATLAYTDTKDTSKVVALTSGKKVTFNNNTKLLY